MLANSCMLHSWLARFCWRHFVLLDPSPCTTVGLYHYFCRMGVISLIPPECNECTWALSIVLDTRGYTHGGRDRCSLSPRHTRPGRGRRENGICKKESVRERERQREWEREMGVTLTTMKHLMELPDSWRAAWPFQFFALNLEFKGV